MNDDELRRRIADRARQLWEPAARRARHGVLARAEEELAPLSVAGEEDPMEALDHDPPSATEGRGIVTRTIGDRLPVGSPGPSASLAAP